MVRTCLVPTPGSELKKSLPVREGSLNSFRAPEQDVSGKDGDSSLPQLQRLRFVEPPDDGSAAYDLEETDLDSSMLASAVSHVFSSLRANGLSHAPGSRLDSPEFGIPEPSDLVCHISLPCRISTFFLPLPLHPFLLFSFMSLKLSYMYVY